MSTPCLKPESSRLDSNHNVLLTDSVDTRVVMTNSADFRIAPSSKTVRRKKSEKFLEEPVVNVKNVIGSIIHMPKELARLCLCDLFSWILICTILIYYTGKFINFF